MADRSVTENQIIAAYKQMNAEYQALATKISELELELNEHNLVLAAIEKLEPSRKCFRLVGGVLVERTVGEVQPAVVKNKEGIQEIITALGEQVQAKGKELNEFKHKYKIQVRSSSAEDEEEPSQPQRNTKGSSGVLA